MNLTDCSGATCHLYSPGQQKNENQETPHPRDLDKVQSNPACTLDPEHIHRSYWNCDQVKTTLHFSTGILSTFKDCLGTVHSFISHLSSGSTCLQQLSKSKFYCIKYRPKISPEYHQQFFNNSSSYLLYLLQTLSRSTFYEQEQFSGSFFIK